MGGAGYVAYPAVGDPVNVAARLQASAPVGGVLIGERDPPPAAAAGDGRGPVPGLRVKGKDEPVDAYLLLPDRRARGAGAQPTPRSRAMSIRCTSLVPSPISRIFASR